MNGSLRKAMAVVVTEIKAGKVPDLDDAFIEAYGGAEHYVMQAVEAARRGDRVKMKRNFRDAQMSQVAAQIELPGMEHAALPAMVFRKDENGEERPVPWSIAEMREIDAEIRMMERIHATRGRVVDGYRATHDRAMELGAEPEMLGLEMQDMFRELGSAE